MNGRYENHGHVKKAKTAKMLIRLMKENKVPNSNYLRETVLRVSLDNKYKTKVKNKMAKDRDKQKYININKGIIR